MKGAFPLAKSTSSEKKCYIYTRKGGLAWKQTAFSINIKTIQIWENLIGFALRRSLALFSFQIFFDKKILKLTAMGSSRASAGEYKVKLKA
ncbi:hypothetical protein [Mucilaginibacter celer]|uniref:hypothetical protein n=1 Tax=Mucilaginibacter celer TaxID=2305508 RepID=UPI0013CE88D9|nr:hypothetical protein [Mucilaginibacter celer]